MVQNYYYVNSSFFLNDQTPNAWFSLYLYNHFYHMPNQLQRRSPDRVIWTSWNLSSEDRIYWCINETFLAHPIYISYVSFILATAATQPCQGGSMAGCSHLCLPITANTHRCSCPSYGGITLRTSTQCSGIFIDSRDDLPVEDSRKPLYKDSNTN